MSRHLSRQDHDTALTTARRVTLALRAAALICALTPAGLARAAGDTGVKPPAAGDKPGQAAPPKGAKDAPRDAGKGKDAGEAKPAERNNPREAANNRDNGAPDDVDRSASAAARRELAAARLALMRAEANQSTVQRVVITELRSSDAYQAAARKLREAQADYDRVRALLRDQLRQDENYRADAVSKDELQAQAVDMHLAGSPLASIMVVAREAMRHGVRMTNAETIVQASEPLVEEYRQRMLRAAADVRQYHDSFNVSVPTDPRIKTATEDLTSCRERVRRANEALADALKREEYVERQRQARDTQQARGKQPAQTQQKKN
jgi:hypothetical protein